VVGERKSILVTGTAVLTGETPQPASPARPMQSVWGFFRRHRKPVIAIWRPIE